MRPCSVRGVKEPERKESAMWINAFESLVSFFEVVPAAIVANVESAATFVGDALAWLF